jgi:tetratricopeptide (TPR) repeat protein
MPAASFSILGDNPVGAEDDRLGFSTFVEPFATRLIASYGNTPFTVGVFADWGQGKTTVLQMLRSTLDRQGCPTIWFDPWKYNSRDMVWKGLALTLIAEVRRSSTLRKEISRKRHPLTALLAEGLLSRLVGGNWAAKIVKAVETEPWSPSLLHELEATLEILFEVIHPASGAGLGKPLVLFVDDLDRCLPEPALAVLEALKLVLNKPGLITVMGIAEAELSRAVSAGYSKELKEAGSGLDPAWGRNYLRKMIQMPFPLPTMTWSSLDGYIGDCLARSGVAAALRDDERWQGILREVCQANLREVKRLINNFISEMDKAAANSTATGLSLDAPRVAFILLLAWRYGEFLEHIRRRADDPELLVRYQLFFVVPVAPQDLNESLLAQYRDDVGLASLFQRCMRFPEDRPPLVTPFSGRDDFEPYLQFGRRTGTARNAAVSAATGAQGEQSGIPEVRGEGARPEDGPDASWADPMLSRARELAAAGQVSEAAAILDQALAEAEARAESPRLRARIHAQLGQVQLASGSFEEANAHFQRSYHLAEEVGDIGSSASALLGLARSLRLLRDLKNAVEFAWRAVDAARRIGDPLREAAALEEIGSCQELIGDLPAARQVWSEALERHARVHNVSGELSMLFHLAELEARNGELLPTLEYLEQARPIAESIGDRQTLLKVLELTGRTRMRRDDRSGGEESYREAAALAERLGNKSEAARLLKDLAELYERAGYMTDAERWYQAARELGPDDPREARKLDRALSRVGEKQDQQSG